MEHMTVAEASRDLDALVDRVSKQGVTIELEQDNRVVAVLSPSTPVRPRKCETMDDLAALLNSLPRLGDDAEAFERDLDEIRKSAVPEADPWES